MVSNPPAHTWGCNTEDYLCGSAEEEQLDVLKTLELNICSMALRRFRIQYASNLFVDKAPIAFDKLVKPVPHTKVLALLGNIGRPTSKKTHEFLEYCASHWNKVLWIMGPHELTNTDTDAKDAKLYYQKADTTLTLANEFSGGITILNHTEYHSHESNVTIAGASLWSPNKKIMPNEPEFRDIFTATWEKQITPMKPETYIKWNKEDIEYFETTKKYWNMMKQKRNLVFLSHHLPLRSLYSQGLSRSTYNRMTLDVNALDNMMGDPIRYWLGGSTGSCSSGMFNNTFCGVNSCFEYQYTKWKPNRNYDSMRFVDIVADESDDTVPTIPKKRSSMFCHHLSLGKI